MTDDFGGQARFSYARFTSDSEDLPVPLDYQIQLAVTQGKFVYIGSTDNQMYALDTDTGRLVWRYTAEGQITSSTAISDEAIYFGCVDGAIYSLDAKTGALRWRFQTEGPVTSSPTLTEGLVYIGSSDRYVYALPL